MAMMVRVALFIVAVVALHSRLRFLGMIAAIAIPWLAVSYANAGPIRSPEGAAIPEPAGRVGPDG